MKNDKVEHLSKEEIIKNGSIFTPNNIVKKCKSFILPYIKEEDTIIDFGSGYGAFISEFIMLKNKLIATDIDSKSVSLLNKLYPSITVIEENSLIDVKKEKYGENIIVIGNPPYNDITSQYKKGEKGVFEIDDDIKSRDLGISFLRMYSKINAKYICVLHPLSYLIKKQNFNSLKEFKDNYKLINGEIFSSSLFESIEKGKTEFPVVIALYERNENGMDFDFIKNFSFKIYDSDKTFVLNKFKTIDGIIEKYPTKDKKDRDLQFYTIRDINALKRNKTFITGKCNNGIKVDLSKLHYYAWLDFFKNNFNPSNYYVYGNLTPLIPYDIEDIKEDLLSYIINDNKVVNKWLQQNNKAFFNSYKGKEYNLEKMEEKIKEVSLI